MSETQESAGDVMAFLFIYYLGKGQTMSRDFTGTFDEKSRKNGDRKYKRSLTKQFIASQVSNYTSTCFHVHRIHQILLPVKKI